ncbi:hypothetical protein GKE82_09345 [Conexibacter sp. W3-3-2]|uniref:metallophosphoesterase family protein n=1 Tax=Conexibacter sp. W3-3-2 TaxID=2675227 RepID=UPI0012B71FF8|nr:metallophosphoesterase [Conexibacter sp. W3-3-2]MTD44489.1 hypothetical protein [Conexibacter sp. W3-3-2]
MERGVSRRELLVAGAAGAGGLLLGARGAPPALGQLAALRGGLRSELVTVTPTGFSCWWATSEASDSRIVLRGPGLPAAGESRVLEQGARVHVASVEGLQPGREYRYELWSGGRRVPENDAHTGVVTTLRRPAGRVLATIAVLNDIHVGEGCSGTISGDFPPCFSEPGYAIRMTAAAVRAIRRLRPDLLVVNGDLTDRGRPDEVRRALAVLRRARVPLAVTRGNHDRRFGPCGEDGDCLRMQAFGDRPVGAHALSWSRDVGPALTVIGLDSCDPDSGRGRLDLGDQLSFLDRELTRAAGQGRRALVLFHHPIVAGSRFSALPPFGSGVDPDRGGRDALGVLARHPHVALVLHGHTHRNLVAYDERIGERLPFVENGAGKEYPAGFALLRFHEDGVTREFHRMDEPFVRDWVATSARQVYGRQAEYTRGPRSSRGFTHLYGRRGFQPAPSLPLSAPDLPFVGS